MCMTRVEVEPRSRSHDHTVTIKTALIPSRPHSDNSLLSAYLVTVPVTIFMESNSEFVDNIAKRIWFKHN